MSDDAGEISRPWLRRLLSRAEPIVVETGRAMSPAPRRATRLVQRGASEGLLRVGLQQRIGEDFYHRALTLSWARFLLFAMAIYLIANLIFATLYSLQPGAVANARPGYFRDLFFFSVETFGTIGYGRAVAGQRLCQCGDDGGDAGRHHAGGVDDRADVRPGVSADGRGCCSAAMGWSRTITGCRR